MSRSRGTTAMRGVVLSFSNQHARVKCEDDQIRLCTIKGKRIRALDGWYNALAAGDYVSVQPLPGAEGVIESLLSRKNVFGRYNEKGSADQAFAANIDIVVCVTSTKTPPFRPRFVDRVSVLAEQCGAPLLVVCNKVDLGLDGVVEKRCVFESLVFVCSGAVLHWISNDELRKPCWENFSFCGMGGNRPHKSPYPVTTQRIGGGSEKYTGEGTQRRSPQCSFPNPEI